MPLETGSYIANLVATNPPGTDPKQQGDDHLRLIKTALLNCFPGLTGSIMVTGTDGGAMNAYTVTPTPALLAYSLRMIVVFSPVIGNSTASTLEVSGLGVRNLRSVSGDDLVTGELAAGTVYAAFYNGTEFRLLSITKGYADQLAFSAALPGQAGNAGKMLTTNGSIASWTDTFGVAMNEIKGADIASAATVNLTAATGNYVHITGTTTITAFTIPQGAERMVVFDGALTLTNSANLLLPTGANITTVAGDTAIVRGDTATVAKVTFYQRNDGTALSSTRYALGTPTVLTPAVAANLDALNFVVAGANCYLVEIEGIRPNSGAGALQVQFANSGVVDSGSNYLVTNSSTTTTATEINVTPSTDSAGKGASGTLDLSNLNNATTLKVVGVSTGAQSISNYGSSIVTGFYIGAAVSGIRFKWSGGLNFAAVGNIRIYPIFNT